MMSLRALGNLGTGGAAAKAASSYYKHDSADYYIKDAHEEQDGSWIGEGAEALGLTQSTTREELQLAFAGYLAGQKVQNAGSLKRQMGWDFTYSAPKSVSVAWGSAAPEDRRVIQEAHLAATKAAFHYLEAHATTRRGYAGTKKEAAGLAAAVFTHYTSREGDPQLHSHVVVPNFCVRKDGSVGTLESQSFYSMKMAAGALYQAELSYRMRGLGYEIENAEKGTFRLKSSKRELETLLSKRDQMIDRVADEQQIRSYAGTRGIVLATRPAKEYSTFEERQAAWIEETREAGLKFGVEPGLQNEHIILQSPEILVDNASTLIHNESSVFEKKDMVREVARGSFGQYDAVGVLNIVDNAVRSPLVTYLGKHKSGMDIYSTPAMIALEATMMNNVKTLLLKRGFAVSVDATLKSHPYLSEEQKQALMTATQEGSIAVIQGRAGAGKTTTLKALAEAYGAAGLEVQGIALSGQAAQNLEKETGIISRTIASWELGQSLSPNTVLVLDEAGMVGSKQMNSILEQARDAGAKVILVGDEHQLQPIDAGGSLHAIDQEILKIRPEASSQIATIRRQRHEWMRDAVQKAAGGDIQGALDNFRQHDTIRYYRDPATARTDLVDAYLEKNAERPLDALILSHRKGEATLLNEEIRARLQEAGVVKKDHLTVNNGKRKIRVAKGDTLLMTQNDYNFDVRNGQRGVVVDITPGPAATVTVQLQDGGKRQLPIKEYKDIDYGWAVTTHKSQGATVENAYVIGHTKESMASRQATYVQLSRAREETKIYAIDGEVSIERKGVKVHKTGQERITTADEIEKVHNDFAKSWSRDFAKGTTLDYSKENNLQDINKDKDIQLEH